MREIIKAIIWVGGCGVCIGMIIVFMLFTGGIHPQYLHRNEIEHPMPQIENQPSVVTMYGCPGCPSSFMEFAEDMCHRFGLNHTISDGVNTLQCSEMIPVTEQEVQK